MKLPLFLFSLPTLITWTASAQVNIPIVNPGFEADVLTCSAGVDCFQSSVIPGWLPDWFNGGYSGTFKPGPAEYPLGIPGGVNVAYLGRSPSPFPISGGIFQALSATLLPNTTYTLTLNVGARADEPFTGYVATLLAGGMPIAIDDTLKPAPGTFLEDVMVYKSGPTLLVGQLLAISIRSVGTGQVSIDNVSLTATP